MEAMVVIGLICSTFGRDPTLDSLGNCLKDYGSKFRHDERKEILSYSESQLVGSTVWARLKSFVGFGIADK